MVTRARIAEVIGDLNPEALTADGFDEALIGYVERAAGSPLALYDTAKCIEVLQKQGMTEEDAVEYFYFNVVGSYVGEGTPVFATIGEAVDG